MKVTSLLIFCFFSISAIAQKNRGGNKTNNADIINETLKPRTNWNAIAKQKQLELEIHTNRNNLNQLAIKDQIAGLMADYDCVEVLEIVEKKGNLLKSLNQNNMPASPWLKSATVYAMPDGFNYVVAEMQTGITGLAFKKYLFCFVPAINWNAFVNPVVANGRLTHGERFNKYIIDFKCTCQ